MKKYILLILIIQSCTSPVVEETISEGTPVTVTTPVTEDLQDIVELNATSSYLLKTPVRSNSNGYLQKVYAVPGKYVTTGQVLFVIRTKESESLGNTISGLDSSLHFDGLIHIKSPGSGYISSLAYREGNYVQDGEQLAIISDSKSFVFLLSLPYELKPFIPADKKVILKLPDSTQLTGYLDMPMPVLDSTSQTLSYQIKVNSNLPENLIAKVALVKSIRPHTVTLPKSAVLSDEMQSSFWIMKLIDSSTAVKVLITKGMETAAAIEILTPVLSASDKIILTGNYGLSDTAKVTITQ